VQACDGEKNHICTSTAMQKKKLTTAASTRLAGECAEFIDVGGGAVVDPSLPKNLDQLEALHVAVLVSATACARGCGCRRAVPWVDVCVCVSVAVGGLYRGLMCACV
jgi:hypothetical protein